MKRKDVEGTVYLIHFDEPFGHARHYLGWSEDLDARLSEHYRGTGANLIKRVVAAGIGIRLVRVWQGTRALERRLKNRKNACRICPVCVAEALEKKKGTKGERPVV